MYKYLMLQRERLRFKYVQFFFLISLCGLYQGALNSLGITVIL